MKSRDNYSKISCCRRWLIEKRRWEKVGCEVQLTRERVESSRGSAIYRIIDVDTRSTTKKQLCEKLKSRGK